MNRLAETIYPDGVTNATVYDGVGRVAQTIDARGTITTNDYDVAGRRIAVTNAVGTSVVNTNFYQFSSTGYFEGSIALNAVARAQGRDESSVCRELW